MGKMGTGSLHDPFSTMEGPEVKRVSVVNARVSPRQGGEEPRSRGPGCAPGAEPRRTLSAAFAGGYARGVRVLQHASRKATT